MWASSICFGDSHAWPGGACGSGMAAVSPAQPMKEGMERVMIAIASRFIA